VPEAKRRRVNPGPPLGHFVTGVSRSSPPDERSGRRTSALRLVGGRIGRHASIYIAGNLVTLLLGVGTLAAVTRLLAPGDNGKLGVLLFFGGLTTVVYNLASFQGAISLVFGSDDELVGATSTRADATDRRSVLGTAVVWTIVFAALGTALIALEARTIAEFLLGSHSYASDVIWAGISGALAAPARLLANIYRYGRRPFAFITVNNVRPAAALIGVLALNASHTTVGHVIQGFAVGSFAGLAITLIAARRQWRPAFDGRLLVGMLRRGAIFVPIALSWFGIQSGDVFMLSRYSSGATVGVYRVGSGLARIGAYGTAAFRTAWGPLLHSPLSAAADAEHGREQSIRVVARYYFNSATALLLFLGLFAPYLVRIAPATYSSAAPLIPIIATGYVFQGATVVIYVGATFGTKRAWYAVAATTGLAAFVLASVLLIPSFGEYGAATAVPTGMGASFATMIGVTWANGRGCPLPLARITAGLMVGAACAALALALGRAAPQLRFEWACLGLGIYPPLLILTRCIPRTEARALRGVARSFLPELRPQTLGTRLHGLTSDEADVLEDLLSRHFSVSRVADMRGQPETSVRATFVHAMCGVARVPHLSGQEASLSLYLLQELTIGDRDELGRSLILDGVSPLYLDRLAETASGLRRLRRSRWPLELKTP
jgi:O-antigen/teichoic acid export membrane protein